MNKYKVEPTRDRYPIKQIGDDERYWWCWRVFAYVHTSILSGSRSKEGMLCGDASPRPYISLPKHHPHFHEYCDYNDVSIRYWFPCELFTYSTVLRMRQGWHQFDSLIFYGLRYFCDRFIWYSTRNRSKSLVWETHVHSYYVGLIGSLVQKTGAEAIPAQSRLPYRSNKCDICIGNATMTAISVTAGIRNIGL